MASNDEILLNSIQTTLITSSTWEFSLRGNIYYLA